jgi:serine/threonine protein kinase
VRLVPALAPVPAAGERADESADEPGAPAPHCARSKSDPVFFAVTTGSGVYTVTETLALGDIATVYGGTRDGDGRAVAIKVVESVADDDLMQAELRTLRLLTGSAPESPALPPQQKHLPVVLDTFRTADGRTATIFERIDGIDLIEARARLPDGLPDRHMIWLLRRCLSVLGHAHAHGILHGNIEPAHVLVRAKDHNVWLVDWAWSIDPRGTGGGFRCAHDVYGPPEAKEKKPPLPGADLYALGKTMIFAAGGDPSAEGSGALPDAMAPELALFLRALVQPSALGRPQDAWALYARLDRLREELYGPHAFVPLLV